MNKTRGRIYWIIFVIFILVFILLAISHQQAAAEMAADRRYSFSLTLEPYDPSRQSTLQSQQGKHVPERMDRWFYHSGSAYAHFLFHPWMYLL